eukprot:scaffold45187_cov21-Tisochrysis_lutea.AAC.2
MLKCCGWLPPVLPLASLNINQHNVRMALVSASAALSAQDAVPAKSCAGLRALTNRGTSVEQLLEQGGVVQCCFLLCAHTHTHAYTYIRAACVRAGLCSTHDAAAKYALCTEGCRLTDAC